MISWTKGIAILVPVLTTMNRATAGSTKKKKESVQKQPLRDPDIDMGVIYLVSREHDRGSQSDALNNGGYGVVRTENRYNRTDFRYIS